MKKSNKFFTSVLAGALLFGGAALGTNALFSDEKTSENQLTLTTGQVKIDVREGQWIRNLKDTNGDGHITVLDNVKNQIEQNQLEVSDNGEFKNVQAGDTFTRPITVDNRASTYDVEIAIKAEDLISPNGLENLISVDSSNFVNGLASSTLPKGANFSGYITVTVGDKNNPNELNGMGTFNLNQAYTVTATQIAK